MAGGAAGGPGHAGAGRRHPLRGRLEGRQVRGRRACWCRPTATATRAPSSPGAREGLGRATLANGDVYDGGFVADLRSGAGTLTAADGYPLHRRLGGGPLRGRGQGDLPRRLGLRGRLQGGAAGRARRDRLCRRPQLRGRLGRRARSPARGSRDYADGLTYEGAFRERAERGPGQAHLARRLFLRRRLGGRASARARRSPIYADGTRYEGGFEQGQRAGAGQDDDARRRGLRGRLGGRPAERQGQGHLCRRLGLRGRLRRRPAPGPGPDRARRRPEYEGSGRPASRPPATGTRVPEADAARRPGRAGGESGV